MTEAELREEMEMDLYEVDIVRLEERRYKIRVRAYDREDAEEAALRIYSPATPDSVEVLEEYAEQIDWAGP